jgi:hypothetical protein
MFAYRLTADVEMRPCDFCDVSRVVSDMFEDKAADILATGIYTTHSNILCQLSAN